MSADHGRVFEGILKQCGLETNQIVLEVPEYAVPEKKRLGLAIAAWQEKGYHIALDGFGREHVQISRVLKLQPSLVKLDKKFLQAARYDTRKLNGLSRIVHEANHSNVTLVGTGIETNLQLDLLREMNIPLAQGFLFGKPQPYCLS